MYISINQAVEALHAPEMELSIIPTLPRTSHLAATSDNSSTSTLMNSRLVYFLENSSNLGAVMDRLNVERIRQGFDAMRCVNNRAYSSY